MGFDTIHETAIEDITSILRDGLDITKDVLSSSRSAASYGSITKATRGLVMEFPVLVSKSNHIESAGIVAKAYETKFVTLLHLAFCASNITNNREGMEYIRKFHTNLKGEISVDAFIAVMDGILESTGYNISADSYALYKAVTEDMRNMCYHFQDDINKSSLESYKIFNNYGSLKVVQEIHKPNLPNDGGKALQKSLNRERKYVEKIDKLQDKNDALYQKSVQQSQEIKDLEGRLRDKSEFENRKLDMEERRFNQQITDTEARQRYQAIDTYARLSSLDLERQKTMSRIEKDSLDMANTRQDMITNYIVPTDIKKANELTPTMMVVNFVYKEDDDSPAIYNQMVIGVKAKLYEVEPMDVINKLITKHSDRNLILKLIKVNTRQISFVKDFLFAIDDAKLYALTKSRKGSTNKLFKVLERRALGSKMMRGMLLNDYCKAITSLVISQEEAEELLKNNIDVHDARVIRPIMEQLNLISFAIIDESSESVKFIFDTGDDIYETIPLDRLEREQKDGMSRKVINLMAKLNR